VTRIFRSLYKFAASALMMVWASWALEQSRFVAQCPIEKRRLLGQYIYPSSAAIELSSRLSVQLRRFRDGSARLNGQLSAGLQQFGISWLVQGVLALCVWPCYDLLVSSKVHKIGASRVLRIRLNNATKVCLSAFRGTLLAFALTAIPSFGLANTYDYTFTTNQTWISPAVSGSVRLVTVPSTAGYELVVSATGTVNSQSVTLTPPTIYNQGRDNLILVDRSDVRLSWLGFQATDLNLFEIYCMGAGFCSFPYLMLDGYDPLSSSEITLVPEATSVTVPSAGTYAAGQDLIFTANYNGNVTVDTTNGTPRLALTIGSSPKYADYISGTGTRALVFKYTVQEGDADADGIGVNSTIDPNGGSLNALTLTLISIPPTALVWVDTSAPSVTSAIVPSDGTYTMGQNLSFTVNWSEAVTVTGTPRLALTVGTSSVYADYDAGSSTATESVFTYTVQAGDLDLDGISVDGLDLNTGTITDAASNAATLTLNTGATSAVLVDAVAASVDFVTVPSDGIYMAGQNLSFTVNWSEAVIVNGTPRIALTLGTSSVYADYISGSGSSSLEFRYLVQESDADTDGITVGGSIDLNGGTIFDGVGTDAVLTLNAIADVGHFDVQGRNPATELAAKTDAIRQTLTDDATRVLSSTMFANQSMVQDVKERFDAGTYGNVALHVDGSLTANPVNLSTMGRFFGQSAAGGGGRQLAFGTFDVQRDDTSGASTATFSGKIAWERAVSESTLLGYFIGGDVAQSNVAGSFSGDQGHLGIMAGGYGVHKLAERLYLDGFATLGAGRGNLTMTDSVLALDGDYTTRTASLGASLSGVIVAKGYEIWPELALNIGRTWIGNVGLTGTASGVTDNTLSLDAGMVTLANLTFRPEFRVPLDGSEVSKSLRLITLAPRLICQQTTTTTAQTCGGGAEIGLQTHSADGTATASAQILSDWIDGQTRTSGQLSVEMRF
jgi:hypothetical protein